MILLFARLTDSLLFSPFRPVKKKGGTAAGVPRPVNEANTLASNGNTAKDPVSRAVFCWCRGAFAWSCRCSVLGVAPPTSITTARTRPSNLICQWLRTVQTVQTVQTLHVCNAVSSCVRPSGPVETQEMMMPFPRTTSDHVGPRRTTTDHDQQEQGIPG